MSEHDIQEIRIQAANLTDAILDEDPEFVEEMKQYFNEKLGE